MLYCSLRANGFEHLLMKYAYLACLKSFQFVLFMFFFTKSEKFWNFPTFNQQDFVKNPKFWLL